MWDSDGLSEGHIRSEQLEKKHRNGLHLQKGHMEREAGWVPLIGLEGLAGAVGDIDLDPWFDKLK